MQIKLSLKRVVDCWKKENNGDPVVKCDVIFQNEINGNFIKATLEEPMNKIIEQQAFFRSGFTECPTGKKSGGDCFHISVPDGGEGYYQYVKPSDIFGKSGGRYFLDPFLVADEDGSRRIKNYRGKQK